MIEREIEGERERGRKGRKEGGRMNQKNSGKIFRKVNYLDIVWAQRRDRHFH